MLLLGIKNTATQSVATDNLIDFGSIYRKYCRKCAGTPTFAFTDGDSISLQQSGMYHLTITAVGTGDVAGDVTLQLIENGIAVPSAISTQTITTPTTEIRTFVIDYYILVNSTCLLENPTTLAKTISVQNTGVDATFTSVVANVEKVS